MRDAGRVLVACLFIWTLSMCAAAAGSALKDLARLEPLAFADLAGWEADDHATAFRAFLRSCRALEAASAELRPAQAPQADLLAVCREALKTPQANMAEAKRFFETHFQPHLVVPHTGGGFLTGYYEPEFQGSRSPDAAYRVPLLDRPQDLVTIPQGETLPGIEKGLQAARRTSNGYEPYPDRAAIEDGVLGDLARPIVWLREPGEAFILHVQGSARIRLTDDSVMRVAYAGRNGRPYTSIGRVLVQQGAMDLESMTLEKLMGWLKDNPEPAKALMRQNQSYIFFREAAELAPEDGPIGGAGHPLVPGRSLAVDRSLWAYGLPIWLDGQLPLTLETAEPLQRLMIAQDTGSAIVGPARGDFFFGSGEDAGRRAGLMRHSVRFVVLQPKPRS
ncbi:membrane-bound lytic murein transglycosylase A [Microvirga lupini]|uniref:peptidoglycan lytic exotransglycosylase n=1 Tax=Microvirga lupini TaxID=420324 RepID=A0A7W4VQA7_9HYPH|nr:MltA domain-containing protein [Microvirga lupini]MBB3021015.1 membrane-bound lytic murein transglycosylase A [Microvirga lupini]